MKALLKTFWFLFLLTSILPAQRKYSFSWHAETIKVDDLTRHFTFFIPRACPENAPIVFVFHNSNSGMEKVFHSGDGFNEWPNLSETEKFILLAPNGVNPINGDVEGENQKWNDCRSQENTQSNLSNVDDVKFVKSLIDWSKGNLSIDEKRIYITGVGNGGMMVYKLAAQVGEQLAGVAVFLANMPAEIECGLPKKPLPIFIMNSKDDPFVPYEGGAILGERGKVLSAVATLNYWVHLNQLNTQKRTNKFYDDIEPDDNSRIIKNEFDRPLDNPPVVFNVVTNSGHVVPSIKHRTSNTELLGNQNEDIEGVEEAWKFLRNFTRR